MGALVAALNLVGEMCLLLLVACSALLSTNPSRDRKLVAVVIHAARDSLVGRL